MDKHKFKRGQVVTVNAKDNGHEPKPFSGKILHVYKGSCPKTRGYRVQGSPSIWPEIRLSSP